LIALDDGDDSAERQFRRSLFGPRAKVLARLRGVDARQPDLDLDLLGRLNGQRVAVGNADDARGIPR
jgi:hypothetical protein